MENLESAYDIIRNKLGDWMLKLIDHIPNFLLAILVFLVFYLIAKWARFGVTKLMERSKFGPSLIQLVTALVGFAVSTVGLFVGLEILDLGKAVTSLLAGIGVVAMALGFAFQEIASNLISGVILAFNSPMNEGDMIEAHGYIGIVEHIGLRSTTIISPQGQNIQVPNRMIFQNPFTNYSITGSRRIDLGCGISYGDDLNKVEELVMKTVMELPGVINSGDKKPQFYFKAFGDSSINFQVQMWIEDPSQPNYMTIKSKAIKAIKAAFNANGITIPFPIRTLDFGIKGGQKLNEVMPKQ